MDKKEGAPQKFDSHLPSSTEKGSTKRSEGISWTASEFIQHHKSVGWYFALVLAILALAIPTYLLTNDLFSAVAIVIAGVLFSLLASGKPRELPYLIDNRGLTINNKFYPYELFRSFTVVQEDVVGTANFLPLKRFMPELSIHFPLDYGEKVMKVLSDHLPYEEFKESAIDRFSKKIRF